MDDGPLGDSRGGRDERGEDKEGEAHDGEERAARVYHAPARLGAEVERSGGRDSASILQGLSIRVSALQNLPAAT